MDGQLRNVPSYWKVLVIHGRVNRANTAEPISMPFGRLTRVGHKNHVLIQGEHWRHLANITERSAAQVCDCTCQFIGRWRVSQLGHSVSHQKSAMQPFIKILWPLFININIITDTPGLMNCYVLRVPQLLQINHNRCRNKHETSIAELSMTKIKKKKFAFEL